MTKKTLLAMAFVAASAGTAAAGGSAGSLGVGAEYMLNGTLGGGPSLNYDTGAFHVGGYLTLVDGEGDDNTNFGIGGRFYYHLHSTAMSDFSIGGAIGLSSLDTPGDRTTELYIEPGVQIRAFVAANVALSFSVGLSIGAADAGGLSLEGQPVGIAGVHYYFF